MLDNIISRICHDLLSPINGLSLCLETLEDQIPSNVYSELSEYISNFNKTILLFRMVGMQDNVTVVLSNVISTITNYAEQFDTVCAFTHHTSSEIILSTKAKLLIYMYLIAQKIIGKSGALNITIYKNELLITISSDHAISPINEDEIEHNSVNALLTFALENCKKITKNKVKQTQTGSMVVLSLEIPSEIGAI